MLTRRGLQGGLRILAAGRGAERVVPQTLALSSSSAAPAVEKVVAEGELVRARVYPGPGPISGSKWENKDGHRCKKKIWR